MICGGERRKESAEGWVGSRIQHDGDQKSWGFVRDEDQKIMDLSKPELTVDRLSSRESAAQG